MATANSGYLDMLLNWKYFVDELGVTNYVVIPLDARVAQQLNYLGVPWAYDPDIGLDANPVAGQDLSLRLFSLQSYVVDLVAVRYSKNSSSVDWDNWNKVVHKKSHYFKQIVEMGYSVLVSFFFLFFCQPFRAGIYCFAVSFLQILIFHCNDR